MLSFCHLPMSYPAYWELFRTPSPHPFPIRSSMFGVQCSNSILPLHLCLPRLPRSTWRASPTQNLIFCQSMPGYASHPSPGFLGLPLLTRAFVNPRQAMSTYVKHPLPPTPTYSMFHVRRSMFKFHPPHPALQSSWVKPLSRGVKPGQAQSSSLAGKKDCLFIAVSVASVSSC
jgi:hypothetical protein